MIPDGKERQDPAGIGWNSLTGFLTLASLVGLVVGIGVGAAARFWHLAPLLGAVAVLEPLGALWARSLEMIVLPLVVSFLILAVTSLDDGSATGRMGGYSIALFLSFLLASAGLALLLAPPLLAGMTLDPASFQALAGSAGEIPASPTAGAGGLGSAAEWVVSLVPRNPLAAAARGDMLPVLVFTVLFGVALNRVPEDSRRLLVGFFRGIAQASMVLVRWILMAMPVGVFALSYAMASESGLALAGALSQYLLLECGALVLLTALLYIPAAAAGAVPLRRFAVHLVPAQAVALGTRSSLASLPALLEGSQRMGLPEKVGGFVLPLAVSTFKVNRPLTSTILLLFLAHIAGVTLNPGYLAASVGLFILLSFASPGIPSGGGWFTIFPLLIGAGIPVESALVLFAVDPIADLFKTLVNVTADMVVTTMVARRSRRWEAGAAARAPSSGPVP